MEALRALIIIHSTRMLCLVLPLSSHLQICLHFRRLPSMVCRTSVHLPRRIWMNLSYSNPLNIPPAIHQLFPNVRPSLKDEHSLLVFPRTTISTRSLLEPISWETSLAPEDMDS